MASRSILLALRCSIAAFAGALLSLFLLLGCGEQQKGKPGDASPVQETRQESTLPAECGVVLKGGHELHGLLLSDRDGCLTLRTEADGEVELPWTQVRSVERGGEPGILSSRFAVEPGRSGGRDGKKSYLRHVRRKGSRPETLDTAFSRFHDAEGNNDVFLVGVIHIGELSYYKRLQDILDSMDVVLFEGVGGDDPRQTEPGDAAGAGQDDRTATIDVIMKLQLLMKDSLGLVFQKDALDYERSFWVNADMSWSEVTAELDERGLELIPGEKMLSQLSKILFKMFDPSKVKLSRSRKMMLRKQLAPILANTERLLSRMKGLGGLQEVVLDARNEVATKILGERLAESSGLRIAVFYGAAHMPGIEAGIREIYKLEPMGLEWATAWKMK